MTRFIEGENRFQATLLPQRLDEYIADDNPVRVIEAFVNRLDLKDLGFERAEPSEMGRPAYDARVMLKIYVYGYMNRLNTTRAARCARGAIFQMERSDRAGSGPRSLCRRHRRSPSSADRRARRVAVGLKSILA